MLNHWSYFILLQPAQRFALLALGRAWTLFGSRKNSKPEKCSKMAENPTCPVHALLGALEESTPGAVKKIKFFNFNHAIFSRKMTDKICIFPTSHSMKSDPRSSQKERKPSDGGTTVSNRIGYCAQSFIQSLTSER